MSSINLNVDNDAGVAYITLNKNDVAKTVENNECIIVDLDSLDVAVGLELLDLDAKIPFDELTALYHVDSTVVALLRLIQPSIKKFMFNYRSTTEPAAVSEAVNTDAVSVS